jgi:hypothetical protein
MDISGFRSADWAEKAALIAAALVSNLASIFMVMAPLGTLMPR